MNKITNYMLVINNGPRIFVEGVQKAIADGWQPKGDVFVYDRELCQAMVKYESLPTLPPLPQHPFRKWPHVTPGPQVPSDWPPGPQIRDPMPGETTQIISGLTTGAGVSPLAVGTRMTQAPAEITSPHDGPHLTDNMPPGILADVDTSFVVERFSDKNGKELTSGDRVVWEREDGGIWYGKFLIGVSATFNTGMILWDGLNQARKEVLGLLELDN